MDTNEKLFSSLFNMGRLIRREVFLHENCCQDISHSEIEVMLFLNEAKSSTMRKISDYLKIKPSSLTPVIERMHKKKMLARNSDKKDRRTVYISLTKTGIKSMENKRKQVHYHLKKIFKKISDKNKKELLKIIDLIAKEYEPR